MTTVTIEVAEAEEPPDGLLRALAADLGENEDLSGSVRLVPRPVAAGEQGSGVAAVEVLNAVGPFVSPLVGGIFGWLAVWTRNRRVTLRVRRPGGASMEVVAPSPAEAERLLRFLQEEGEGEGEG